MTSGVIRTSGDGAVVPYGTWATFKRFLGDLKNTAIPPAIDTSMLRNMSGTDQSQLKAALRFFGLVDGEGDRVTDLLHEAVADYNTAQWQQRVTDFVLGAYHFVVDGVDLQKGTQAQLEEAFRERGGVKGSAMKKAVRFYLAAAKEAGATLSPHFIAVRSGGGNDRPQTPRQRRTRKGGQVETVNVRIEPPPPNVKEVRFPVPGKPDVRMWIPTDLSETEWGMLDAYLRAFIKLGQGKAST